MQGQDNVFLAGEMLVDGALGVFGDFGDAIHGHAGEAALHQHFCADVQEQFLTLLKFAFFSGHGIHGGIFDDSSKNVKASFR